MKRASCLAGCAFLSFMWISLASAGPNNEPVPQKQMQQGQRLPPAPQGQPPTQPGQPPTPSDQVIRPKAGISWKEKVLKQREVQKRAVARRNVLMQQAETEKQKSQKNIPPPSKNPRPAR